MHETKYQPMEKADAEAIMEEILGMQCGLNPDQQVTQMQQNTMSGFALHYKVYKIQSHFLEYLISLMQYYFSIINNFYYLKADANEEAEMIIRAIMQVGQ